MSKKECSEFDLVLYHGGCPDGIASAWIIWRENKRAKYIGLKHGWKYPEVTGLRVAILDFSFPIGDMKDIVRKAEHVTLLDHHESAETGLKGFSAPNLNVSIDMKLSGAQITWNYFHETEPWPKFIDYIADRDLWRWTIPDSQEIGKALYADKWYTFDKMEEMYNMTSAQETKFYHDMLILGRVITEQENQDKAFALKTAVLAEYTAPDGEKHRLYLATCNPNLRSEIGNELASRDGVSFCAIWKYDYALDEWWISLRASKEKNIPLLSMFKHLGCGGHPNACGITIYGSKGENLHTYFKKM